jgi:hypothetical protein
VVTGGKALKGKLETHRKYYWKYPKKRAHFADIHANER